MGEREREGRREAMGDRDGEGREGKEGHRGGSEDGQGRTRGTPSIPTTCPFKRVLLLANVLFLTLPRAERDENRRCMVPSAANREGRRKKKIRRVFLNQESSAIRLRRRKRQKKRLATCYGKLPHSPTPPDPNEANTCNPVLPMDCHYQASLLIH